MAKTRTQTRVPHRMTDYLMNESVVEIPLTRGKVAIVDAADAPSLLGYSWQATNSKHVWYARRAGRRADGSLCWVRMHRQILGVPEGVEVDHKDGDGLNNRRDNLRSCTRSQNVANRRMNKNNSSGFRGVEKNVQSQGWRAGIAGTFLGSFATAKDAALAYDTAARRFYGEFARLNFPDETTEVESRYGGLRLKNTSGCPGVIQASNGRWVGKVFIQTGTTRRNLHVGRFDTLEEAAKAVVAKRREFGKSTPLDPDLAARIGEPSE